MFLELHRADVAAGAVFARSVVEQLDVVEERRASHIARGRSRSGAPVRS